MTDETPKPPRPPARRFMTRSGYRSTPLRPEPENSLTNEPPISDETRARIREATNICDEPEQVSDAIVDAYGDLARTYDIIRHEVQVQEAQQARQLLPIEKRMVEAQRRAKRQHVDVSHELHVLGNLLERARRGNRDTPPDAIRRIEEVEARLDHRPDLAA